MKKYYKINEIAKLYHIKTDSLRYYEEVGLLHPIRSKSNYRLYTLDDIYLINIIRDCLKLGYDTCQIKEYLDHRSVENTIQFLKEEQRLVHNQMKELQTKFTSIQTRIQALNNTKRMKLNTSQIVLYPTRYCRYLKENMNQSNEVDFLLTKLQESMEENVSILGNMDSGSILEYKENKYVRTSVFILTEEKEYDFILESGNYCVYTYKGIQDTNLILAQMKQWIEKQGYLIEDPFLEFLLIDVHETKNVEEYVTSIHVKIKSKS